MVSDSPDSPPFGSAPDTPPSRPPDTPALRKVRQSADRLKEIEQDLVRRIVGQYDLDRRMQQLIIELQICTTRMQQQLEECTAETTLQEGPGRFSLSVKE